MDKTLNLAYALGLIVGLIIAAGILTFMSKTRNKAGKLRMEFDERQKADRNSAFATGFMVLVVLDVLTAALRQAGVGLPFDHLVETIICCLMAAVVSVILCIHREAWLSLREKPRQITWALLLVLVCNGLVAWVNWSEMWTDGVLNFRSTNLFVALFMAVVLIAFSIKRLSTYLAEIHDGLQEREV